MRFFVNVVVIALSFFAGVAYPHFWGAVILFTAMIIAMIFLQDDPKDPFEDSFF